jgi:pyruvate-formate lyase-activating enzyme
MDKVKRAILLHVHCTACNFRCPYCYILQFEGLRKEQLPRFRYTPAQVAKAFAQERMGGVCYINICAAGETLLPKEVPSYVAALLAEGHYVDVVSNCTLEKRIDELLENPPEALSRLMVKASFHWLEMKRTNTLASYIRNIKKLKAAGVSYTIEITPYDGLVPHISEIIDFCNETFGSLPQITIAWNDAENITPLTKMPTEEFRKVWGVFKSPMTDAKLSLMGVKRKEFCYAGDWALRVQLDSGQAQQCYQSCLKFGDIFKKPEEAIKWKAIGNNCLTPHCRNGHMLMTLGAIPGLTNMRYETIRNRVCSDGSEWLSPSVKAFLLSQLKDSNEEYSSVSKAITNIENIVRPRNIASKALPEPLKAAIKKMVKLE